MAPPPPKCYPLIKIDTLNLKCQSFTMVFVPGSTVTKAKIIGRDEVYVAAVALKATKGPPQLLMSTAYSLNLSWDLQHFMVIIKPILPNFQALVFDFQPQDPENVYVALAALSGRKVPGVVLTRKLTRMPKTKCWKVGYCSDTDAIREFNKNWETDLVVGRHDCRHYTNDRFGGIPHWTKICAGKPEESSLTYAVAS